MKNFKQYVHESEHQLNVMESFLMLYYVNNSNIDSLNEQSILTDFAAKMNSVLPKLGMKLHKGDGIISYLAKFASVGGKMLIAAVKRDSDEIKRLAGQLDRAEFIDFLLKLDMATLHLVTNPIHTIDAITGWDLMANIKAHAKKAVEVVDEIVNGIKQLKTKIIQVLDNNVAKPFLSFFDELENTIGATPV